MKKEFNRNDLAAIKRAAASIAPLAAKRDKLTEKINKPVAKRNDIEEQISFHNGPIQLMTGYADKTFVFKYPETIVPDLIPEVAEAVETIDETAVVDEVETAPADSPYKFSY